MKTKIFISIAIIGIAFVLYLLSLLEVFPLLLSVPLLFGAVFLSVSFVNGRNRFKGF
ncbi:hypothetical protein [Ectobacillus panaciterrae]|uniref:hypothetical protein n=1 Tax=Ectobacillus panaciterrae TaxID=363872 RepID=UPI000405929C|nr:hypothetical protein [Ectobacillus panaciterrae]